MRGLTLAPRERGDRRLARGLRRERPAIASRCRDHLEPRDRIPATVTTASNGPADPVKPAPARPRLVRVARNRLRHRACPTVAGLRCTDSPTTRRPRAPATERARAAWPPYLVPRRPARGSAFGGLVGTVRRTDGRLQVTYAGRPLYHYVGDLRPGQVLCQGVTEFGGGWYVVAPSGHLIR